jgi:alanine racemase
MRATRAVVNLGFFRDNIALVRELTGVSVCVPVKAGAYGHGALPVARAALEAGARYLAVATVEEGEELREGGVASPVLLLSLPLFEEIPRIIAARLEVFAAGEAYLNALADAASQAGRGVAVHLKVDTGMGRIGCRPEEAADLAALAAERGLMLAGTATHLAVSDSAEEDDRAYTALQLERFAAALDAIRARGINPGIVHAANSGAVTFHRDAWFDMVRPGILLYGYVPRGGDGKPALPVKPVMSLESRVVFLKKVKQGESVSYGRVWTAPRDTVIATIPAGYADGLPRCAGGRWEVFVEGRSRPGCLRPLAGRICMDQCMIDMGADTDAAAGDRVVIFGGPAPDAAELAARTGTIPYEICCNVSRRVPRIYVGEE